MPNTVSDGVNVPEPDQWPGVIEAYKIVKQHVKPQIWNFVSVIGIGIIIALIVEIIFGAIFKRSIGDSLLDDLAGLVIGAFLQAAVISMYFAALSNHELTLNEALLAGYNKLIKMTGLLIVMDVVLVVSFVLLIVPFLFILPRVYLAPYFLIHSNCSVSEALAASWHLTKGNIKHVYEIIVLDIAIAILFITIIGIPFALYFGIINSGSFALFTLYLLQPKKTNKAKVKSEAKASAA